MDKADSPVKKVMSEPEEFAKLDHDINACLTNSYGPAGMKACLSDGIKSWDKELNKTYNSLLEELADDRDAKRALRKSEREWIKFRDSEFQLIDRQYKKATAETHPQVDVLANKLDVIETRARELSSIKDRNLPATALTNPIDRKVGECLQKAPGDLERGICISNGIEDWKSEYASQLKLTPERFKPAMRASEKQWSKFHQAESEFISRRFPETQATPAELSAYLNLLRDRTIQLSTRNSVRFK